MRVYLFEDRRHPAITTCRPASRARKGKRAISTAMGYNQPLTTNTVELLAEQDSELVRS